MNNQEKSVVLDCEFQSAIEKVWFALTDAPTLSKWMLFEADGFQPVAGHKFQFRSAPYGGWDGVVNGDVLEVDAPYRLSYTWIGGPETLMISTTVTWTLREMRPGATQLHLEQSGFPSGAKQAIGGAQYGWKGMMEQLRTMLAVQEN